MPRAHLYQEGLWLSLLGPGVTPVNPKPCYGLKCVPPNDMLESWPRISEGARPCQHLDFRVLASRTVRTHIAVILSHSVCDYMWQPQE